MATQCPTLLRRHNDMSTGPTKLSGTFRCRRDTPLHRFKYIWTIVRVGALHTRDKYISARYHEHLKLFTQITVKGCILTVVASYGCHTWTVISFYGDISFCLCMRLRKLHEQPNSCICHWDGCEWRYDKCSRRKVDCG